jgi:phage shock protein E
MRLLTVLLICLLSASSVLADTADTALRGDAAQAGKAWPMIEAGALVIDVRSEGEFSSGYLNGAIHIPHEDTQALIDAIGDDKSRQVVLYCGSGRRADTARLALEDAGYEGVYNASGLDALLATEPE